MIIGDFDVLDAQRQHGHVAQFAARAGDLAGFGGPLEGDAVAALCRCPFPDKGARMMPIGGSVAMMAGEMAAIGSFRYWRRSSSAIGSGGKVGELAGEWNHLAAKAGGELFHGRFGPLGFGGHPVVRL